MKVVATVMDDMDEREEEKDKRNVKVSIEATLKLHATVSVAGLTICLTVEITDLTTGLVTGLTVLMMDPDIGLMKDMKDLAEALVVAKVPKQGAVNLVLVNIFIC